MNFIDFIMFNDRMIMKDKLMRTGKEFEFPMLKYGLLYHCLLDIKTFISLEILKFPDPCVVKIFSLCWNIGQLCSNECKHAFLAPLLHLEERSDSCSRPT
jgi:hypothetical protein